MTSAKNKIERFCYKWLPIFFGCHCRADRSFFYKGKQFPICARCTGMLIGMLIAIVSAVFWRPSNLVVLAMALPAIIDGTLQRIGLYESTNIRRLITGILLGIVLIFFIIKFATHAYQTGFEFGRKHF